jgi:hypothetical protein
VRGASDNGSWSSQHTMHAFGSYYVKSMCMGKQAGT